MGTSRSSGTRRMFVQGVTWGAVGWMLSRAWSAGQGAAKIAEIEAFPIRYPTVGRFKFFEGPKGVPSGRPAVIVKMTADDGTYIIYQLPPGPYHMQTDSAGAGFVDEWYDDIVSEGDTAPSNAATVNVFGDPHFVDPAAWDYRLSAGSAAIDRGLDAGVTTDLEDNVRPIGRPDLGAYEGGTRVTLPLVLRGP